MYQIMTVVGCAFESCHKFLPELTNQNIRLKLISKYYKSESEEGNVQIKKSLITHCFINADILYITKSGCVCFGNRWE